MPGIGLRLGGQDNEALPPSLSHVIFFIQDKQHSDVDSIDACASTSVSDQNKHCLRMFDWNFGWCTQIYPS